MHLTRRSLLASTPLFLAGCVTHEPPQPVAGGGRIPVLEDTADVAFTAVRVEGEALFRLALGGITGHKDFARDTGVVLPPGDAVKVSDAILRVFIQNGWSSAGQSIRKV